MSDATPNDCPQCGKRHAVEREQFCSDECEDEYWKDADIRNKKSYVPNKQSRQKRVA